MSELIDKMVTYRARNNISQKKLAEMCGVTEQTINSVEQGKQTPSRITEKKIMLVIGKEDE